MQPWPNASRRPATAIRRRHGPLLPAATAAKKQAPVPTPPTTRERQPPPTTPPPPRFSRAPLLDADLYASLCADPAALLGWTVLRSAGVDPVVGAVAAVSRAGAAAPPLLRLRRRVAPAAAGDPGPFFTERHAVPFVREWFPRADPGSRTLWLRGAPPGLLEAGRQRVLFKLLRRELTAFFSGPGGGPPAAFPSAAELRAAGRGDLAELVRRAGGQAAAAMALGLPSRRRPRGYWDADESVAAELDALVRASWVALPAGGGRGQEEDGGEDDEDGGAVYFYNTASLRHSWDAPFGEGMGAGGPEEEEEDDDDDQEAFEDDDDDDEEEEFFGEEDDDDSDDDDDEGEYDDVSLSLQQQRAPLPRAASRAPPPLDPRDRVMPPAAAVLAAGRHDLHAAIVRLGGYAAVGARLGRPPANGRRPRRPADPRAPTAGSAVGADDAWWLPPSGRRRERQRRRRRGSGGGGGAGEADEEEDEDDDDDEEDDELARVERLRLELLRALADKGSANDDASAPVALPTRRELLSRGRPDLWRAIVALGGARALAAAHPDLLRPGPRGGSVLCFDEAVAGLRALASSSSSLSAPPAAAAAAVAAAPTVRQLREAGEPELARAAAAHGMARLARAAGLAYRRSAAVDFVVGGEEDYQGGGGGLAAAAAAAASVSVKGRGGRPLGGSASARVWLVVRRAAAAAGGRGGASPAELMLALSGPDGSRAPLVARASLMRMLAGWVEAGALERRGRGRYAVPSSS